MNLRIPKFFGLHAEPTVLMRRLMPAFPFAILIAGYLIGSAMRLAENPEDRFMPSPLKMAETVQTLAFTEDEHTGTYLMLEDTLASLRRVAIGLGLAALAGLLLGVNMGLFPGLRVLFEGALTFIAIIPSLLLLPILLILFGVDELSKILIIFIGTAPTISRDLDLTVQKMISREQVTKALSLGASQLQVVYFVVLPQIIPRWLDTTRLMFGAALMFLVAAESVAATAGLGHRTFIFRRQLIMDGIIPYVLWATLISIAVNAAFKWCIVRGFPWYEVTKQD